MKTYKFTLRSGAVAEVVGDAMVEVTEDGIKRYRVTDSTGLKGEFAKDTVANVVVVD